MAEIDDGNRPSRAMLRTKDNAARPNVPEAGEAVGAVPVLRHGMGLRVIIVEFAVSIDIEEVSVGVVCQLPV